MFPGFYLVSTGLPNYTARYRTTVVSSFSNDHVLPSFFFVLCRAAVVVIDPPPVPEKKKKQLRFFSSGLTSLRGQIQGVSFVSIHSVVEQLLLNNCCWPAAADRPCCFRQPST